MKKLYDEPLAEVLIFNAEAFICQSGTDEPFDTSVISVEDFISFDIL